MTDYEALSRAYDVYLIKNVMGRHAYHHALGTHRAELDEIWSRRDDISWHNPAGFWVGRETLYAYYADAKAKQDEATLKLMAKFNPNIEVKPENFQMGALMMHSLTTPLIEIADDGKTAQAMWYSLGQVTNAGPDGTATGVWMHERYAVDFIKEDDGWKIWHFFVGTDFSFSAGTKYEERPMGPAPERPKQYGVMRIPGLYTSRYNWSQYPHWPVPYETWTPEISYGPEPFMKEGE